MFGLGPIELLVIAGVAVVIVAALVFWMSGKSGRSD
jgi:hypothetical protein